MTIHTSRGPDPRFFDGRGSGCSLFERPAAPAIDFRPIDEAAAVIRGTLWRDSLEALASVTARAFEVDRRDLTGPCREPHIARARHALMWLARETTMWSAPEIGRRIGGRDHSTVLHSIRVARRLRDSDPRFRLLTDAMVKALAPLAAAGREVCDAG